MSKPFIFFLAVYHFSNYNAVGNFCPSNTTLPYPLYVRGKGKFHLMMCREGTGGGWGSRNITVLCLTLGTKWGGWSTSNPGGNTRWQNTGTHWEYW